MERGDACWATPAKARPEAAGGQAAELGGAGFETPAAASPASAFGFPSSVLQPSRFRPRPLFPVPGATPRRSACGTAAATQPARTPARRARGGGGVDLYAPGGSEESPALSCRDENLAAGAPAVPWSQLYVLPHRRAEAESTASGWSGDSEPAAAAGPSTESSPASARQLRRGPVNLSPLARLLHGAASASAPSSPASHGQCALQAAAGCEAEEEARTPNGKRQRRRSDAAPPERPARPRLCELLMRHHREAAMRVDPL